MWLFKIFLLLWNTFMPLKVQKSVKFKSVQLTCIIMQHGSREKRVVEEIFKDVRTMSVVSDKQRQAGSSGSAPATPQGNNLPPAVPPPSISRNPLRGSKCNNLHFTPVPPLPYPLTLLLKYNKQYTTLEITDTFISYRVHL